MEDLEPRRVRIVRVIRVRSQSNIRVSCVAVCQIRRKIPETTILRFSNEGDSSAQLLSIFRGGRHPSDKAEAELISLP